MNENGLDLIVDIYNDKRSWGSYKRTLAMY